MPTILGLASIVAGVGVAFYLESHRRRPILAMTVLSAVCLATTAGGFILTNRP